VGVGRRGPPPPPTPPNPQSPIPIPQSPLIYNNKMSQKLIFIIKSIKINNCEKINK